jgi:hypothetical protein
MRHALPYGEDDIIWHDAIALGIVGKLRVLSTTSLKSDHIELKAIR